MVSRGEPRVVNMTNICANIIIIIATTTLYVMLYSLDKLTGPGSGTAASTSSKKTGVLFKGKKSATTQQVDTSSHLIIISYPLEKWTTNQTTVFPLSLRYFTGQSSRNMFLVNRSSSERVSKTLRCLRTTFSLMNNSEWRLSTCLRASKVSLVTRIHLIDGFRRLLQQISQVSGDLNIQQSEDLVDFVFEVCTTNK